MSLGFKRLIRQLEKHNQLLNRIQRKKILAPKSIISYKFERTIMCTSEDLFFFLILIKHMIHEGEVRRSLTQAWHLLVLYGCHTLSPWALADPLRPVCPNDPQSKYNSHSAAGWSHVLPRCQHFHIAKSVIHCKCIFIAKIGSNIIFLMQALVVYSIIPY